MVVFYLLRTDAHLLGDGFQILESIDASTLSINWSQPLAIWIHLSSFKLLNHFFPVDGAAVYAMISYVSGVIYVIFALRMAMLLGKSSSARLFGFLLLILTGSIQLFFGYAEHYPLLYAGTLIYLFYCLKVLRRETKILIPVIVFFLLLPLHFSSLCFFPSILFLFFFAQGGKDSPGVLKSKKALFVLFFLLVIIAALVLYILKYRWFAFSYLVPLLHGGYTGPGYTLFSPSHLLDFINQQLLISPIGLALFLAFLIFGRKARNTKDRTFQFLLTVSAAQLLFNFLINPGLGAARDWDLFAGVGLGYTLLAFYLFSRITADPKVAYLKLSLTVTALLFVLPWILINAAPDKSVARFRNLLDLDPRKSRNGHFILAGYFDMIGKPEEVDRENRRIKQKFPEIELTNEGHSLLASGDLDSAYHRFTRAIEISPDFAEAYAGLSWYYYKSGNLEESEQELRRALKLKPDYRQGYLTLGEIYMQKGLFKRAQRFYIKALKLGIDDPLVFNNLGILYAQFDDLKRAASFYRRALAKNRDLAQSHYGLAHVYYRQGKLKESLRETNLLLQIDPRFVLGYYQLGLTYEGLGRKKEAAAAYQRYTEMQPNDPEAGRIKELIERLRADER
jgi:tetratricopeptide (TPR) repeat protein